MRAHYSKEALLAFVEKPFYQNLERSLILQDADKAHNNSRYIFYTQIVLRGKIAEWAYKNIGGSGTQLQQYVNEICAAKHLEHLYDVFSLEKLIKPNTAVPPHQKNLYAAGFIGGLLEEVSEEVLFRFLLHFFIEPNDHHLPKVFIPKDDWQKLLFLCKQYNYPKPGINIVQEGALYVSKGAIGDIFSAEHSSVSYQYAKKKTVRMLLKQVVQKGEEQLLQTATHQQITEQQTKATEAAQQNAKEERQKAYQAKLARKKQLQKERTQQRLEKAKLADSKRRKAKSNQKEKKQKVSIYRAYSAEEIAAMTTAKRRRLEDKGIL
ncbi:MAG: hypothetical protein IT256_08660 [Chitinophagaceae bacterium]|nr:hypothetical protein [Chitinophagaceae bacterium]